MLYFITNDLLELFRGHGVVLIVRTFQYLSLVAAKHSTVRGLLSPQYSRSHFERFLSMTNNVIFFLFHFLNYKPLTVKPFPLREVSDPGASCIHKRTTLADNPIADVLKGWTIVRYSY